MGISAHFIGFPKQCRFGIPIAFVVENQPRRLPQVLVAVDDVCEDACVILAATFTQPIGQLNSRRKLCIMTILKRFAVTAMCVVLASQFVAAQQFNPGRIKALGEAMQGHEHQTYQNLAQQRAHTLYYYAQSKEPVPMTEAKELVAGIKKDLSASDAALAKLKAAHAKEPEVVKLIESIEKHHAKAHEVCGMAEEACSKEHGDHVVIGNCCSEMYHEIDAAKTETAKLLKMLKIEKLDPPKKVEAKK